MIKAGSNFKYKVRFVQHRRWQDGTLTSFSIGDRIKNGKGYQNWKVTIWDYVDVNDGDSVLINKIISVETVEYNGKIYYNMTADVQVNEQQGQAFTEEAPPVAQTPHHTTTAPVDTESRPPALDDDTEVPFDI